MTATTDPRLVTAAEAARLLGVTRQRVLELADSADDFPASQPAATGGWAWPRVALQAWAAANPDPGPVFAGPEPPPLFDRAPQLEQLRDLAADQAFALNHDSIGLDHLLLAMLQPRCPGAAGAVLQSFRVHADRLRRALIDSRGDPYGTKPTSVRPPSPPPLPPMCLPTSAHPLRRCPPDQHESGLTDERACQLRPRRARCLLGRARPVW